MQATYEASTVASGLRTTTLGPGFHSIPEAGYHAQEFLDGPALTASIAKLLINQSPRHAYHSHVKLGGNQRDPSDEMDTGNIFHTLALGKQSNLAIGNFDDWRTKVARDFRTDARANGMTPVLECKMAPYLKMAEAFAKQVANSDARDFYADDGETEITAVWDSDGVICQSMIDRLVLSAATIYDIKTIGSAHPKKIEAQTINMGYDIQGEFYRSAVEYLCPELAGRVRVVFLFVETSAPYVMTPVEPCGMMRALGESKVQRAINTWRECLQSGYWPGYTRDIISVSPPKWAFDEELSIDL